jgi:hypothetical protein
MAKNGDVTALRRDELYVIGATRIGYSAEDEPAHELAARWLAEAGLGVEVDRPGNTFDRRSDAEL